MGKKRLPAKLVSDVVKELGRQGGQARAKRLSAVERQAIARKAAQARWGRAKREG